jgi:hypothetical protein
MKKSNFCLLTSGLIAISTLGIISDLQASNDIQLISPPLEQECFMMASVPQSSAEMQAQIKAKKESILKKIEEMKNSSPSNVKQTTTKPTSVTKLDSKPKKLYTLSRFLDYSPHPTTENILKNKPVLYNGKNYHFTVTYNEDWKDVTDDFARLNSISFTICVYENGKKVRNLTTPKVQLDSKKVKKGQMIGIAEVSPFKFNISVSNMTVTKKGITELEFKLDLIG